MDHLPALHAFRRNIVDTPLAAHASSSLMQAMLAHDKR
jgi:hypothetical protein